VKALMTDDERAFLRKCCKAARGLLGRFVDLGTFQGASARLMCEELVYVDYPAETVLTIDNYLMQHHGESSLEIARKNLEPYTPEMVNGDSAVVPPTCKNVAMLLIDTEHSPERLRKECEAWLPLVSKDGIVALHDYGHHIWTGMKPAIDSIFSTLNWDFVGHVGLLIDIRRS